MLCLNRSQIFQIKTRRQGIVKEVFSLGLFFSSSSSNLVSDKDLGRPRRDSLLLLLLLGRLKCAQSFVNALASHSSWGSLRPSWNSSLKSSCSMKSHTTFFNESSRLIFSDGSHRAMSDCQKFGDLKIWMIFIRSYIMLLNFRVHWMNLRQRIFLLEATARERKK